MKEGAKRVLVVSDRVIRDTGLVDRVARVRWHDTSGTGGWAGGGAPRPRSRPAAAAARAPGPGPTRAAAPRDRRSRGQGGEDARRRVLRPERQWEEHTLERQTHH